jgi:CDP-glucose 4,6-dehydratase
MESVVMNLSPGFWQGKRVLLTGHTGFKGSWLALWLTQMGARVHGVALAPDMSPALFDQLQLKSKLASHQLIDVCNPSALAHVAATAQPEVVLHLAAQPLVRRSYLDPLGTWATNVQGSLNLLEAIKLIQHPCAVVMVTTDKVYANQEWDYGYREDDRLGGHDPYSASKAAAELAIASWRASFCGEAAHQTKHLAIATARAGNVIGGGDWSEDRIVPDVIRSLVACKAIPLRQPLATRPWQHVLEPLGGYLLLAQKLAEYQALAAKARAAPPNRYASTYNFGPSLEANRSVSDLVESVLLYWPGSWLDLSDAQAPHEAGRLHLQIDKAHHQLGWQPRWSFATTVERTVRWYQAVINGESALACCLADLEAYLEAGPNAY